VTSVFRSATTIFAKRNRFRSLYDSISNTLRFVFAGFLTLDKRQASLKNHRSTDFRWLRDSIIIQRSGEMSYFICADIRAGDLTNSTKEEKA
jgi:hypothetical protein